MEHKKIEKEKYTLNMNKTGKFKSVLFSISFSRPLNKKDMTYINFLNAILVHATKKYRTKRLLLIAASKLYGLDFGISKNIKGNYYTFSCGLKALNDEYTDEGNFEKSILFLKDIIYNPFVNEKAFNKEIFKIIKNKNKDVIKHKKANMHSFSVWKMLKAIDPNGLLACSTYGDEKVLEEITASNMYGFYQKVINESIVDVNVTGNIDFKQIEKMIDSIFNINGVSKFDIEIINNIKEKEYKEVIEEEKNAQSYLNIGYKINEMSKYERYFVWPLYKNILGSGTQSKLFNNVREKHSLCYSIGLSGMLSNNLAIISAGIDKEKYEETLLLIEKDFASMKKGQFNERDVKEAKTMVIEGYNRALNSLEGLHSQYLTDRLIPVVEYEKRKEEIAKVTKEEIVTLANKLEIIITHLLKGVDNNE